VLFRSHDFQEVSTLRDFERRQTLVNGERFVTPELRDLEARILSARADREALESKLWADLQAELAPSLPVLREAAAALAREDVLQGFAHLARGRNYARPEVVDEPVLLLEESRHPVLELDSRHQPFVPNPVRLDTGEDQIVLLTGPNMGGKSTYLRQTALVAVMAQTGSYVPAKRAVTGLTDRLFCRVGAGDSLLRGLSTFMMEMTETAAILRNATARSLVILDEVLSAQQYRLIREEDILELLEDWRREGRAELVLSGRTKLQSVLDAADLVTEMRKVKHYFDAGVPAREGIEY